MKVFLGLFLVLSTLLVFVLRTLLVWRRTGVNPIAFKRTADVHSYIGGVFILVEVIIFASIGLFMAGQIQWLGHIDLFDVKAAQITGAILLVVSTIWAAVAQAQMGRSWRIGIDRDHETELVTSGLFRWSRNPIFLAMQVSMVGLFLALPTVSTLVVLVLGHVLINVQVRLEESYLRNRHGEKYLTYQRLVRRWI